MQNRENKCSNYLSSLQSKRAGRLEKNKSLNAVVKLVVEEDLRSAIGNVLLEERQTDFTFYFIHNLSCIHVHADDMLGQRGVFLEVMLILDNVDHVETRENCGHEINVVIALGVVPSAEHRVGSSQN